MGVFFGESENQREQDFDERAIAWPEKNFGGSVIHARADQDEAAYHNHAVIMPRTLVEFAKPKAKMKVATKAARGEKPPRRRYQAKTWQWRVTDERGLSAKANELEAPGMPGSVA